MTQPPLRTVEAELRVGAVLSRYVIVQRLGAGSGGVVYAAYDTRLNRRVALKVLRGRPSEIAPGQSGGPGWKRLVREAQIIARLDHPHVVTVHDLGIENEHAFIAMELVEGDDLAVWLARSSGLSWTERVRPLLLAAEGLAAAHEAGVVHGDFKPGNVLLGKDGRVRVSDFGISLLREPEAGAESTTARDGPEPIPSTQEWLGTDEPEAEGWLWGTPLYAAPELFESAQPSTATDIYGFCVSLYEAIYGEPPVRADSAMAMYSRKLDAVSLPRSPHIPCALRQLIAAGLRAQPVARPPTMRKVVAVLRRSLEPMHRRWFAPAMAALVLAAAGSAWAFSAAATQPCRSGPEHLAGVWNDTEARATKDALHGTGVAYAETTWKTFEASIDDYGQRWVQVHRDVCLATQRGEQSSALLDRRMTCLEARRAELGALIDAVKQADRMVAGRAAAAAADLSPIDECLAEAVIHDEAGDLPPAAAVKVASLRAELGRARALYAINQHERGLALTHEVLGEAEALGFAPLHAEALRWVGKFEARRGNYEEGDKLVERAAMMAEEHRVDDVAARAWLDLMWSHIFHAEDGVRTMALAPHVEVALHRAELGPAAWHRFFRSRAYGKLQSGDLEGAAADIEQAIERARQAGDAPADRLDLLAVQAELHEMRDELDEAARAHEQRLELSEAINGRTHPTTISSLEHLAEARMLQGQFEDALALREEALEAARETLGQHHPARLGILVNHANALTELERYDEALEAMQSAREGFAATVGVDHPRYAGVLGNLSATLGKAGRHAEAAEVAEEATEKLTRRLGAEHPWVAHTKGNLGASRLRAGDPVGALAPLREAIELHEQLGSGDPQISVLRFDLARALEETGRTDRAVEVARQAGAETDSETLREDIDAWLRDR